MGTILPKIKNILVVLALFVVCTTTLALQAAVAGPSQVQIPGPTSSSKASSSASATTKPEESCACSPEGSLSYCGCQLRSGYGTTFVSAPGITEQGCVNAGSTVAPSETLSTGGLKSFPIIALDHTSELGQKGDGISYIKCFREPVDKAKDAECSKHIIEYFKALSANIYDIRQEGTIKIRECLLKGGKLLHAYIWLILEKAWAACGQKPRPTSVQIEAETIPIDAEVCDRIKRILYDQDTLDCRKK